MPSEHQAKATLQTRIEKGKAFKNEPWLPEQSHWVTDGRSGTPSGEPAVQSAVRCTGCRGGWRLRRRDSNPLFAGRLRPPRPPRPPSPGLREAPVEPSDPRPPASPRTGLPPPSSSQVSLPSHPGASRPVPVPAQQRGLVRLPRPSGPQPRLLSRTHYLPQANVARDGQSEGQCNVLHGLSHGSVQNPANTEVPPTAALRHAGNARGRLRRPGRAIASRARGRKRASERRSRPVVFSFPY